ncbi:MAG: efflux RND transporter periplasmic adaptor subunit, partial [Acidobacteriota bacterium]|nr:efflux RND transporter periplasmic adaptor subunit [Acidobacteriota bacterium]
MADVRRQTDRRWIWVGAVIVLVLVFFTVRNLTRERLPVRIADVERQSLLSTVSTNGRVEPTLNYELHSPIATTVEAVYVQPGDVVPAGKLLMKLDDIDARARVAAAESALRTAQADLVAARNNGTPAQRDAAASEIERSSLERDQDQRSLDALAHLQTTGAASAAEVDAARQRLAAAQSTF